LHPPQKFEHPPFCSVCSYEIKNYGVEVNLNGVISLLNFIKIYQLFQKLIGGRHTDRLVISFAYIFLLGRKVGYKCESYYSHSSDGIPHQFSNCEGALQSLSWINTAPVPIALSTETPTQMEPSKLHQCRMCVLGEEDYHVLPEKPVTRIRFLSFFFFFRRYSPLWTLAS
jgi:hypothetical protein